MLKKGQSVLITGPLGIGKTHFLTHVSKHYETHALFFSSPTPLKSVLLELVEKLTPSSPDKPSNRTAAPDILDYIVAHKTLSPPILIIDDLQKLKQPDMDFVLTLLNHFTILGAAEDTTPRLKSLWWKFKAEELHPLSEEHSKTLIRELTKGLPITDYTMLETRLLTQANGMPLAFTDMTRQLRYKNVVTREAVRELRQVAGVKYRDWSWLLAVFWGGIVLSRFIALGFHSFEGYILAGVGTSIFLVIKMIGRRAR